LRLGHSLEEIREIIENPTIKGFKLSVRKARDFTESNTFQSISKTTVKEGKNINGIWIKCNKEREECDAVNEKGELYIINLKNKTIIKLEYI